MPPSSSVSNTGPVSPAKSASGQGDAYPWYAPRVWSGMTASVLAANLWRARFAVSPLRWPMTGILSGLGLMNSGLRLASEACFRRRAEAAEVAPPLFVLGHWRSGTTLLHELLVMDEQFTFPTTYQCLEPHHFLFSESWFAPMVRFLLPRHRPMDAMPLGLHLPQEDEFALCNLGAPSSYLYWAFPGGNRERFLQCLDLSELPRSQQVLWQQTLLWFTRRIAVRNSRRIVFKSPPHTARVKHLQEVFPQAQFIHIARDPYVVFQSTVRTFQKLIESQCFQRAPATEEVEEFVLAGFTRMYEAYFRDVRELPSNQLCEVRFEQLLQNPVETLAGIYRQLSLGDFEVLRPRLEQYFSARKDYQRNEYRLAPEVRSRIRSRWGSLIERLGYAVD